MVIHKLSDIPSVNLQPLLRIREETTGGVAIEPATGIMTALDERALLDWNRKAEVDNTVIYYAAREWSSEPLKKTCTSSPQRIYAEITNKCNLSCSMCYKDSGNAFSDELSSEEYISLIRHFANIGVFEIRITGGEPGTRKDVLTLIDASIDAGLYVSLGSNGVWDADFRANIIQRRIGRYIISIDGIEPVHDSIRGSGSFRNTISSVDFLLENKQKVRINTILSSSTLQCLEEFCEICIAHGIKHLSLVVPRPAGRADKSHFKFPSSDDVRFAAQKCNSISKFKDMAIEFQYFCVPQAFKGQRSDPIIQKLIACPAGIQAAFVNAQGYIYPCGCMPHSLINNRKKSMSENIRGQSARVIWESWQNSNIWSSFRDPAESKMPSCFTCEYYGNGCFGSCPVHSYIETGKFNGQDPMCWQ